MRTNMQTMPTAFVALLALLAFLGPAAVQVQAADILFFKTGGCDDNPTDYGFCTLDFVGECCQAFDPLCGELACRECESNYLEPFWGSGNCTGYNQGICTINSGVGINCCMELGSNATCSGHVGPASSTKRLDKTDTIDVPCTNPRHLDGFSYIDTATKVRHEITNMTKEVHDQIMDHYRNGNYIALNNMAGAV